jgi:hypothetical protein
VEDQARSAALAGNVSASSRPRGRLVGATVAVRDLDQAARDSAFALFAAAYDEVDRARFLADLEEKQHVIVMRDRQTRELKGFSTVSVRVEETERGKATVVFSGDTVIDRDYWGQKELHKQFSLLVLRLQMAIPLRPLYWLLVSKGYKTYLTLVDTCPVSVPRHERPEDPRLRKLLDRLAGERFGAAYQAATGIVVNLGHERVRTGLSPIDESALANPHVRYFLERNPGHTRGDELACLAMIRKRDSAGTALRVARARLRKRLPGG